MEKRRPGRGQSQRVREVTRARLLAAAEEMFLSHGFAAATVDAIAHEAGYTTGAVYSNFGGKADLFLAVLDETAQEQLTAVRAALDSARSDEERLDVVNTSLGDPARWRARVAATIEFLSYARHHAELQKRLRAAQQLADQAGAELVSALCRALGVDPPAAAHEVGRELMALVNGLSVRSLYDDELDLRTAISRAVSSLLTGDRSGIRGITDATDATAATAATAATGARARGRARAQR